MLNCTLRCCCLSSASGLSLGCLASQYHARHICPPHAESASLLGRLIHNAPQLVLPYVSPIEKALVGKLRSAAQHAPLLADPAGPIALPKGTTGGGHLLSSTGC